jgi:hypothetical protein
MKPLLLVLIVVTACSERAAPQRGPEYTAVIANQLRGVADQCEIKRTPGQGDIAEVRSCLGPRSKMRLDLAADRRIRVLELSIRVASAWEARRVAEPAVVAVASPAVLEAVNARLQPTPTSLGDVTVDGVRVGVTIVGQRYTVTLAW